MNSLRVANLLRRLIPLKLKTFWTKLVCTHGWNRKSCVKGIQCNADITAAVAWNDTEGALMVRMTDYDVLHNHAVSKATCQNHVSNCQVQDPTVLAFMNELQICRRTAANASDCACFSSSCAARYRFRYD
ncbi:ABC transporter [Phytophthora megakarya]|uniref:ABC transporter n=1 Tax=Phytophthora megakarya TaxID=4795 RepID=A0A225V542_9STRA|nr:ABC transporter [Phytophthora megakarya]